jgi:hypothetical protein
MPIKTFTAALVSLGNPAPAALLATAVSGAAAAVRRWAGVLLTLGGTLTAVAITELILKPLTGRLRYGHLSFPSGHTKHYATDTLAGCCVAAATVPALALVLDSLALHARSDRSQKS